MAKTDRPVYQKLLKKRKEEEEEVKGYSATKGLITPSTRASVHIKETSKKILGSKKLVQDQCVHFRETCFGKKTRN
jgi:hypothetical protein